MTIIRRPSPFGELMSLRQAMDRLFEDSYVRPRPWGRGLEPSVLPLDVWSTADELVLEAAVPGVKPEDVEITVTGNEMAITAKTESSREVEEGNYLLHEISRGDVSRTVTLPEGLRPDRAQASFENGVLRLRIPKAEEMKPRQIRISPTTNAQASTPAGGSSSESAQGSGA